MLALRDYTVRPCRDNGLQTGLQTGLNESESFDQMLAESEAGIRALHQHIEGSVNRIEPRKKEIRFQIFEHPATEEHTKRRFLTAMESTAFDYNQFNL